MTSLERDGALRGHQETWLKSTVGDKSAEDAHRDDTFIDRAGLALVKDPANPGSHAIRAACHATGGVPGVYSFDADIAVFIRFAASGGRVTPDIEAEDNPRVKVFFGPISSLRRTRTG